MTVVPPLRGRARAGASIRGARGRLDCRPMTGRDLDTPYALQDAQLACYRKDGFVKLSQALRAQTVLESGQAVTAAVTERTTPARPMAERTTYERAFVQVTNLWTRAEGVRRLVFSRRLARLAAELMGVRGVRLYHDQALYKEAGGGFTPWHADQYYWPLATELCCTAWLPLQRTPLEMGPIAFAPGSQRFRAGRELPIGDESEATLGPRLEQAGFGLVEEPFELGDVSFHAGWTFHRAGANRTRHCREAITVIYMDSEMRLVAPRNSHQVADWQAWCPGAVVGERIETPLNPVLYEAEEA